jgi:hypothetical protein
MRVVLVQRVRRGSTEGAVFLRTFLCTFCSVFVALRSLLLSVV